jgi:hypothetical protein
MSVTGLDIKLVGKAFPFQSVGPVRPQSGAASLRMPGTPFDEVLRNAQSAGLTIQSNLQSKWTASLSNCGDVVDQNIPEPIDARLVASASRKMDEGSTRPAGEESAISRRGSSSEPPDGKIAGSTSRPPSIDRSSSGSVDQNSKAANLQANPERIHSVSNQSTFSKNQGWFGEGKGLREEKNKKEGEVSTLVSPSITPGTLPVSSLDLPNPIQPARGNSNQRTGPPRFQIDSNQDADEGAGAARIASLSPKMNSSPGEFVRGSENGLPISTSPVPSVDRTQLQRSVPDPVSGSVPASLYRVPASLHSDSAQSDLPLVADSDRKGARASSESLSSRSMETAQSTRLPVQFDASLPKSHLSTVNNIEDSASANLRESFGASHRNLEDQAGISPAPAHFQKPQISTSPTDVFEGKSTQTFKFGGDIAVSQQDLSSAEFQAVPIRQILNSNSSRPSDDLSGTMKLGSMKIGKTSSVGTGTSASGTDSIGIVGHAMPAATAISTTIENDTVSNELPTRPIGNEMIAVGTGAPHQTFEALDHVGNGPFANWVHVGAQRAEAGFQDPALGWIAVRADQSGGGVHATVLPATTEAAQSLGSQMTGLSAHLADAHPSITSLSLGTGDGREDGTSAGHGFNQGAGQDRGQQNAADSQVSLKSEVSKVSAEHSLATSSPVAREASQEPGSRHISVLA